MRVLDRVVLAALAPLTALGIASCGGDEVATYEPVTDPTQLYMRLTLNSGAITMAMTAPYNTLQLTATPRDALGAPIEGVSAPTFTSSDTTSLYVTADGVLTARQPVSGVMVIAEVVAPGNVRHADTALVTVTADPPPSALATFSIHPITPDSAIWSLPLPPASQDTMSSVVVGFSLSGAGQSFNLPWMLAPRVRALDAAQNPVSGLNVEYFSLDPLVARIDRRSGGAMPLRAGRARIVARTMAYGIAKSDTVIFTVTPPVAANVSVVLTPDGVSAFGPARRIRPNGVVYWANASGRTVDIVYSDPTNVIAAPDVFCNSTTLVTVLGFGVSCRGGDISIPPATEATLFPILRTITVQQFTTPGTYDFRDPQSGATGRIIVTMGDENESGGSDAP